MKIDELKRTIRLSWTKETCVSSLQHSWNEENPALGQCAVTALIVNDYLGGKIMRCMCESGSHYYNLINGEIIDFTVEQFKYGIPLYGTSEQRTRDYLLSNEDTKKRYIILLNNIKDNFKRYGEYEYKLIDENNNEYISKIPGMFGGNKKLKIYGKIDCPSALMWIKKGFYINNRVFFENEEIAVKAGYRPCAKCMPDEYNKWKEENKILILKK